MAINEFQADICAFLKELHRGEEAAIHSKDMEELFGITGPTLRWAVNRLRSAGYPICSSDAGYFYAGTQGEINQTVRRLNANMTAMSNARNGLLYASLLYEEPVHVTVRMRTRKEA